MKRKDVLRIIKHGLFKEKSKIFSMITFHLDNGLTIVTPITLTIYSQNRRNIRISEKIQVQTIERTIPYNKMSMVVLS